MSNPTDNDKSEKLHSAVNRAFTDDENIMEQEEQQPPKEPQDTTAADHRSDSGTFSLLDQKSLASLAVVPNLSDDTNASLAVVPSLSDDTNPKDDNERRQTEPTTSSSRPCRRSSSMDRLRSGAGAFFKGVKEACKVAISSTISPKQKQLADELEVEHERPPPMKYKKEKKEKDRLFSLSTLSLAGIQPEYESLVDSGMTDDSTLPELSSNESLDNLAKTDLPLDKPEDETKEAGTSEPGKDEMETDLPEASKTKEADTGILKRKEKRKKFSDKKDEDKMGTDEPRIEKLALDKPEDETREASTSEPSKDEMKTDLPEASKTKETDTGIPKQKEKRRKLSDKKDEDKTGRDISRMGGLERLI